MSGDAIACHVKCKLMNYLRDLVQKIGGKRKKPINKIRNTIVFRILIFSFFFILFFILEGIKIITLLLMMIVEFVLVF